MEAIVEEKDATPQQRDIREINSGILAFDAEFLLDALPRIGNDNAKGEFYLTDTVRLARDAGLTIGAYPIDDVMQTEGANDRVQLAELGREMNRRIVTRWMRDGVTVMDPATTWIDADVRLEPDVTILPGTQLLGATVVAEDAVIGPDTTLKDCEIGVGARVVRTHGELAVIGARATVGPFSYLRPGTLLGAGGKIGAFVEVKNSTIADGAKVPHLSYVGDARDRRRRQHRRRHHLRQLRRHHQAPHDRGEGCQDGRQQHLRGPGQHRRGRDDGRRHGGPQGRAAGRAGGVGRRPSATSRGTSSGVRSARRDPGDQTPAAGGGES